MKAKPRLETKRLLLRMYELSDAKSVQQLAGDIRIARTTMTIPHPYTDGLAEQWIMTHEKAFEEGRGIIFAIIHKEKDELVGTINLNLKIADGAEIGYWIGVPYWGQGYCTEAAEEVKRYAFEDLKLNRIFGIHMASNPASGRIMQKIGMKFEGCLRQQVKKEGQYDDLLYYGLLADEYKG